MLQEDGLHDYPSFKYLLRRYDWTLLAPTSNTFETKALGGLGYIIL